MPLKKEIFCFKGSHDALKWTRKQTTITWTLPKSVSRRAEREVLKFCSFQFRKLKYQHIHPCVPNLSSTELKRKRDKVPHLNPHFLFPVASNILPTNVKAIIKGTSLMCHCGEFWSLTNLLGTILYVASYNNFALIYIYTVYIWGGGATAAWNLWKLCVGLCW